MATLDTNTLMILVGVALLPPILFAGAIAGAKRYRREPLSALVVAFLWGLVFAALISGILNVFVTDSVTARYETGAVERFLLLALVVAPLVEETTKAVAVPIVRRHADEPVDGIIYGAVAGLGFAAAENFFYSLAAFVEDGNAWVLTAVARTFSSTLLHATATAMTGYGIARAMTGRGTWFGVVMWFVAAVLLHSLFNFLAVYGALFGLLGVIPAILLAVWGFTRVRRSIAALSMVAPTTHWRPLGERREVRGWIPVRYAPEHGGMESGHPAPRPRWEADRAPRDDGRHREGDRPDGREPRGPYR